MLKSFGDLKSDIDLSKNWEQHQTKKQSALQSFEKSMS
jgi:hypothetical protein